MGEIDDAEQAEDDRQTEAQHRVVRAVDEPEQQLAQEGLDRNAEDFQSGLAGAAALRFADHFQAAHFVSALVVNASSPLVVATTL